MTRLVEAQIVCHSRPDAMVEVQVVAEEEVVTRQRTIELDSVMFRQIS